MKNEINTTGFEIKKKMKMKSVKIRRLKKVKSTRKKELKEVNKIEMNTCDDDCAVFFN